MPSTTSSEVSIDLASSTVMTPSLPTFFMASAMISPMVLSLLAETVPTCAIISPLTGLLSFFSSSTAASTAFSIPRFRAIGLAPAATFLHAFAENRLRQHGRGRGAVAGHVGGLGSHFTHHLGSHVLDAFLQLDLFGDRHAVLGDHGRSEFLVEHDVAALRARA